MFQFRAFPSYDYFIHRMIPEYCSGVFPHSYISGSSLICSSPKLFAACHVLHRLLMPRHSPCALISLTFVEENCASLRSPLGRTSVPLRFLLLSVSNLRSKLYYRIFCPIIFGSLELCRLNRSYLQNCIYP